MANNKQILKGIIFAGLFAIPFVPLLVSSSFFFPFITTKAFVFRLVVEVIFASWVILAYAEPEYRPKRGAILWALAAFLLIVGLADLFGVAPLKSFWSNFERMEGYITMLHLGALFLVISSVFREKLWDWWWNTSLGVSAIMVFYSIFQLLGAVQIHQGGVRVDGTLGNAAYLALYFLIHIFIAIFYLTKAKSSSLKWTYGLLILGQTFILYHTATRGAILGLLGGVVIMAILDLNNRENARLRRASRVLLGSLAVFVVLFFIFRGSSFVQGSPVLKRFADITPTSWQTEGRSFVWPMALKGIEERPLLGWGQDNFNYVFAEHYSAEMFRLEPWFDRAHNIFLDWGVSAGLLGLGAYLSLYVFLLVSIWRSNSFNRMERSILTGLIAAYFFNNLFVFDNLVSYVLFIALLAYVHTRVSSAAKAVFVANSPTPGREQQTPPWLYGVVIVTFLAVVYFVNVKPIKANTELIGALQVIQSPAPDGGAIDYFEKAYGESRLGRGEVAEWMASSAYSVFSDESVLTEKRNNYFYFASKAMEEITAAYPNDPRYEMVAGNFFSTVGQNQVAEKHYQKALNLMPEKQQIYFSLAQVKIQEGDKRAALDYLRQAYELAPEYDQAKEIYEKAQKEFSSP